MNLKEQKKLINRQSLNLIGNRETPASVKIVAEGDSWFDYPLSMDIIDWLGVEGYAIKNFATRGDELENMIYGTEEDDNKTGKKTSLDKTLDAIRKFKPRFVLFSGGGNDVVGENMINYLNHQRSGEPLFRRDQFKAYIEGYVKDAICYFIEKILAVDSGIDILMDGYAYARPNGKAYSRLWRKWAGPWILPSMHMKNILKKSDHENIVKDMVDIFNDMLQTIDDKYTNFHYIDLRPYFNKDDQWDNEIHLTDEAYRSAANIYSHKMLQLADGLKKDLLKTRDQKSLYGY